MVLWYDEILLSMEPFPYLFINRAVATGRGMHCCALLWIGILLNSMNFCNLIVYSAKNVFVFMVVKKR